MFVHNMFKHNRNETISLVIVASDINEGIVLFYLCTIKCVGC